jgi:hypothetical protein
MTKLEMMKMVANVKGDYLQQIKYLNGIITRNKMMGKKLNTTKLEAYIEELKQDYKEIERLEKTYFKQSNKKQDMECAIEDVKAYQDMFDLVALGTSRMIIEDMENQKEEEPKKKKMTSEQAFTSDFEYYLDLAISELC